MLQHLIDFFQKSGNTEILRGIRIFVAMQKKAHYTERVADAEATMHPLRRNLFGIAIIRVLVFIGTIVGIAAAWKFWGIALALAVFGAAVFLFLVNSYQALQDRLHFHRARKELFAIEVTAAEGGWRNFEAGDFPADRTHPFASDLNIFGKNSLYQYLNRAQTREGRQTLAQWLSTNLTAPEAIARERKIVDALATDEQWIFDWLARARLSELHDFKSSEKPVPDSVRWKYTPFPTFILRFLLPILLVGMAIAYLSGAVPGEIFVLVLFVPLLITGAGFKKNQAIFEYISKREAQVAAYRSLLHVILKDKKQVLDLWDKQADISEAALVLSQLEQIIKSISHRNNLIVGLVLNIFLLWDLQCLYRLSRWHSRNSDLVPAWFQTVWNMDAYLSLAIFKHNHPEFTTPVLADADKLAAINLAHPLMKAEGREGNDFTLENGTDFAIITGANMAGKSTFLRAVGVNMVLAMRGLPVCAEYFEFRPRQIFTSMLTVDSLGDNESYFFSELKRLRQIMDQLENGIPLFLILDEILKGTNSVDKAKGSEDFLINLLNYPARGVIATHDLSLCKLEAVFPGKIINQKFEVDLVDDELIFDYKLRSGICQNMNATFLLRKMGLSGKA